MVVRAESGDATPAARPKMASAEAAVTRGLELFNKEKDPKEALLLFEQAMTMNPTEDEARAAYYNAACTLVKLRDYAKARDYLRIACDDYKLKFSVILKDPDMAGFRERKEFDELGADARGGFGTRQQQAKLRKETSNPFRNARVTLLGAFAAADLIGLVIVISQTFAALNGSESPSLETCYQNLGINIVSGIVLGYLLYREAQADKKQEEIAQREEDLGALEVRLSAKRVVPISRLRLKTRPIILAGSSQFVKACEKQADLYRTDLLERGVILVPLVYDNPRSKAKSYKGFAAEVASDEDAGGEVGDGDGLVNAPALAAKLRDDSRWRIEPVGKAQWQAWIKQQLAMADLEEGEDVFVQVQLNGSVRSSGKGMPDWEKLRKDLPPVDDARSKAFG